VIDEALTLFAAELPDDHIDVGMAPYLRGRILRIRTPQPAPNGRTCSRPSRLQTRFRSVDRVIR
jgi:hypothetical protein